MSAPTVRYLKLSGRKGANAARNEGIRAARGTFVCGLDDDESHPYSVYFHSGETITGSPRKVKGYFAVYKKHKHLMTPTHRKEQLANLYLVRRKPLSPKTFRTLVTPSLFVPLTGLFLESRTPFLHRLLRWIRRALTDSIFSRQ